MPPSTLSTCNPLVQPPNLHFSNLIFFFRSIKTKLQVQVKKRLSPSTNGTTKEEEEPKDDSYDEHYTSTLDAMRKIVAKSGVQGLYAGLPGALLGVASTNFAYFYWYTVVRSFYQRRTGSANFGTATELSLGAVAGALAQLFTIPVAVVTTRQQTRPVGAKQLGLVDTAHEVIAVDGYSGLWRGLKASLVLVVNPAITYGSYQRFREILFPRKKNLSMLESFVLGALSKAVATCLTQPLIVAKVGLQSRPPPERKGKPFKSFVEVLKFIVEHEGLLGLFKGIGPQLAKGLLVQGVLMMMKEKMELLFVVIFMAGKRLKEKRLAEKVGGEIVEKVSGAATEKVAGVVVDKVVKAAV
jgi:hypothetical protein